MFLAFNSELNWEGLLCRVKGYAITRDEFLKELQSELAEESYRVQCLSQIYIPKSNGGRRWLGIPTVKDKIVQQAIRFIIEPSLKQTFKSSAMATGLTDLQGAPLVPTTTHGSNHWFFPLRLRML